MSEIHDAIDVCRRWFAYLDEQEKRSRILQAAAREARAGRGGEALRLKRAADSAPLVFDGARLRPAVQVLIDHAEKDSE